MMIAAGYIKPPPYSGCPCVNISCRRHDEDCYQGYIMKKVTDMNTYSVKY